MTRNILIIRTDGTTEVGDLDAPEGSLKVLQNAVGGYVEAVDLRDPEEPATMWVNEDGIALGLPMNVYGTLIYQLMYHTPNGILGDIAISGLPDDEGDTTGISDKLRTALEEMIKGVSSQILPFLMEDS
jgi:Domain of unknown function (DUF3846)